MDCQREASYVLTELQQPLLFLNRYSNNLQYTMTPTMPFRDELLMQVIGQLTPNTSISPANNIPMQVSLSDFLGSDRCGYAIECLGWTLDTFS